MNILNFLKKRDRKDKKDNVDGGRIWLATARTLVIIQILSAFVGGFFIYAQWNFLKIQREDIEANIGEREIRLAQDFYANLKGGTNGKIVLAILKNEPILRANKGNFSTDDINQYLSSFQILYSLVSRGLIHDELTYIFFSEIITKTYHNAEISSHLNEIRKIDPLFYRGLDVLADRSQGLSKRFGSPSVINYYQKRYDGN